VRLFFALWPDEEVVRQLAAAAALLKVEGGTRLVRTQNYHLTLAFAGDVPDLKLAVMQQIGQSMRASRVTVVCNLLEYWSQPRVVVAAVREAPAALLDLSAKLNDAIESSPVPLRAHVTLARKMTQAPVLPAMSPIMWRAAHFCLVRSQTGGVESAYTVVDTWQLLDET
jgi:RNA 2',3'-cyclic 3'-phosphodiesterase